MPRQKKATKKASPKVTPVVEEEVIDEYEEEQWDDSETAEERYDDSEYDESEYDESEYEDDSETEETDEEYSEEEYEDREEESDELFEDGLILAPQTAAAAFGSDGLSVIETEDPEERRIEVLNQVARASMQDDTTGLILAERLYEVQENQWWVDDGNDYIEDDGSRRPFKGFFEWADAVYGVKQTRASYLLAIYRTFFIKLGLDVEHLRELDWTKARELCKVVDETNWEKLLVKSAELTQRQTQRFAKLLGEGASITEAFKEAKKKGKPKVQDDTPEERGSSEGDVSAKSGVRTLKITTAEDRFRLIKQALELATSLHDCENEADALEAVAYEFIENNRDAASSGVSQSLMDRAVTTLVSSPSGLKEVLGKWLEKESADIGEEAAAEAIYNELADFMSESLGAEE